MNKRRSRQTEITNNELEEIEEESVNLRRNTDLEKEQAVYKQTVIDTNIPLHGNLRVEEKDEEAVRVLGSNINSLSFCQKENYKAERLKFILEKYGVDTMGLQEVYIN